MSSLEPFLPPQHWLTFSVDKDIDICPGNLEILEDLFPMIDWKINFRALPELFGTKLTTEHLEAFYDNTSSYRKFQLDTYNWQKKVAEMNQMMKKQHEHYENRMVEASTLVSDMNQAQEKYENLLETHENTDDHAQKELGAFDDLCASTTQALRDMQNTDKAVNMLTDAVEQLNEMMRKEPALPAFMKNLADEFNREKKYDAQLSEYSDEESEDEETLETDNKNQNGKKKNKKKKNKKKKKGSNKKRR